MEPRTDAEQIIYLTETLQALQKAFHDTQVELAQANRKLEDVQDLKNQLLECREMIYEVLGCDS
jgi:uncharacterized protein (UPF0147 family)